VLSDTLLLSYVKVHQARHLMVKREKSNHLKMLTVILMLIWKDYGQIIQ